MTIGTRIASMRGYRRLTQEEMGGLVGVTKMTVSNWENDRRTPRANDIISLCSVLGCTSDYLLGMCDDPNGYWR